MSDGREHVIWLARYIDIDYPNDYTRKEARKRVHRLGEDVSLMRQRIHTLETTECECGVSLGIEAAQRSGT